MITNNLYTAIEKNYYRQLEESDLLYQRARFIGYLLLGEIGFFWALTEKIMPQFIIIFVAILLAISSLLVLLSFVGRPFLGFPSPTLDFTKEESKVDKKIKLEESKYSVIKYSKRLYDFHKKNIHKTEESIKEYLINEYLGVIKRQSKINYYRKSFLLYANSCFLFSSVGCLYLAGYILFNK